VNLRRNPLHNPLRQALVYAAILIPLHEMGAWKLEKYSKIPPNQVSFSNQGLKVNVKNSASPIIYPLSGTPKLIGFRVRGVFSGLPKFKEKSVQGDKGADDYALRIGLIVPGQKRLTGIKKFFAASWVKQLYAQLPSDLGLDHVQFFNVGQDPKQLNQTRTHPKSELINEETISIVKEPGAFTLEHTLKNPIQAAALWVSIDGDDTESEYSVLISEIELRLN
jgi:hypothetical protein